MAERRRGLGRGLGALIPQDDGGARPRDVFWPREERQPSPSGSGDRKPAEVGDIAHDGEAHSHGEPVVGHRLASASDGLADVTERKAAAPVTEAPQSAAGEPSGDSKHKDEGSRLSAEASNAGSHYAVSADTAQLLELPLGIISPNPRQPREVFDEEELDELATSIKELGVLQPVVVRPLEQGYQLIMGERRFRASQAAGVETIPAIVRHTQDDELLREALLENLHRVQLNPLEEAAAYGQLLEDFGITHDELARRVGRSRPRITNTLRLLKLPPSVQRRVAAGVLSAGHARALLGLADSEAMERMAQRVIAEGLSVRGLEELIALGETEQPARLPSRRGATSSEEHVELAAALSDRWDTRVTVQMGRSKGKLTVEFAGQEDLDRIVALLAHTE